MSHPAERETRGRPIVGVTCYEEEAAWGTWRSVAAVLPTSYVRAIERAGGIPVLLPPQELTVLEAERLLARVDAVVIAGGGDVEPAHYGERAHPATVPASGTRDVLELAVAAAAANGAVPTLGICRGLQVLNVARGGTLIQHLPDVVGHERHSPTPGRFGAHEVRIEPGSRLAGLVSGDRHDVPTHHHQAIGELGRGLSPAAYAEDGIVEALEDPALPFLLGVQWHPEAGEDPALFDALVAAARQRAAVGKEGLT